MCNLCGRAASEQAAVMAALRAQPPSASSVSLAARVQVAHKPNASISFYFSRLSKQRFCQKKVSRGEGSLPSSCWGGF